MKRLILSWKLSNPKQKIILKIKRVKLDKVIIIILKKVIVIILRKVIVIIVILKINNFNSVNLFN